MKETETKREILYNNKKNKKRKNKIFHRRIQEYNRMKNWLSPILPPTGLILIDTAQVKVYCYIVIYERNRKKKTNNCML